MNNLDRIKHLRAQDYGVAGRSTTDVDWLIAEVERLQIVADFERESAKDANAQLNAMLAAKAKVADDVVADARLGNRLYVWDYENPEGGSWDNIEEYLHDTTPGVGDVVRLILALPLQDVGVEMLEVGECGEPIRWEVRDVKTGAMLAAKAKGGL